LAVVDFLCDRWLVSGWMFIASGLAWFLWFSIAFNHLTRFPCPRCGNHFCSSWRANQGLFAKKCLHCGLERFNDGE
jgi:hypothetical protein